ncbi:hypothetical protein CDCA_CDCA03G1039 [Cyanidium caldarium]|uniref:Uncharacterized protein n=1 Tax=Cyanidium caldarium TaxID=2771 RepID=A0AAV9IRY1_CYACA|nr:hypothetical protein CDCA_CDCA03G1039 [Cyanidium caldarium]
MRRENLFEQLQRKRHVNKGASESTTRRKRHSPTRRAQARTRFNLDSGPQELLTHRGTPLDAWLDERAEELSGERSAEPDLLAEEFGVALESEDEGEEELGIDPVGVEYDLSRGEPHGKAPPPTFREAMQDIIAKSKARKEERRLERVRREQRVHELDEELDQVRDLLRPGRDDTGASGAEPVHVAPVSPFADYEQSILELSTEARGRPQDRAGKEHRADVDAGPQRHALASGDEDDVVASAESDTDTTNTSHEDDVVVSLGEWHSDPAMGRLLEHVDQMAGDVKRVPVLWTADVLWQVHELAGRCVPAAEAPSRVSRVRRRRPAASAPDDGGGDSERLDALESLWRWALAHLTRMRDSLSQGKVGDDLIHLRERLRDLAVLHCLAVWFPVQDARHALLAPAALLLGRWMAQACAALQDQVMQVGEASHRRWLAVSLAAAERLVHDWVLPTGRVFPELVAFLASLLDRCAACRDDEPSNVADTPPHNTLSFEGIAHMLDATASQNVETPHTEELALTATTLLDQCVEAWSGKVPALSVLLQSARTSLQHLRTRWHHPWCESAWQRMESAIQRDVYRPELLRMHRPPAAPKLLNPRMPNDATTRNTHRTATDMRNQGALHPSRTQLQRQIRKETRAAAKDLRAVAELHARRQQQAHQRTARHARAERHRARITLAEDQKR